VNARVAIALAFAACLGCTGTPATMTASAPAKPHAPIDLVISAQEVGGGRTTVTLEAQALVPLDGLSLEIVGATTSVFGPTAAGQRRVLIADVELISDELIGLAKAQTLRGPMGRAVSLRRGGRRPESKRSARVVITPFGPVATENAP